MNSAKKLVKHTTTLELARIEQRHWGVMPDGKKMRAAIRKVGSDYRITITLPTAEERAAGVNKMMETFRESHRLQAAARAAK